jgi:hypothetical protein
MQILNTNDFLDLPNGVLYLPFISTGRWQPALTDLRVRKDVMREHCNELVVRFWAKRFFDVFGRPLGDGINDHNPKGEMCIHNSGAMFAVYSSEDVSVLFKLLQVGLCKTENPSERELIEKAVPDVARFLQHKEIN